MKTPALALALLASGCAIESAPTPEPTAQDVGIDSLAEVRTLAQRAIGDDAHGLGAAFFVKDGMSLLWDENLCQDPDMKSNGVALSAARAVSSTTMTVIEPADSSLHLMKVTYVRVCGDEAATVSETSIPVRNTGETQGTYEDLLAFHEKIVTARGYTLNQ